MHILSLIYASYTEKGYYLEVISLLLREKRVTTYGEKGYYLRVKGLLLIGKKVTTYRQKVYYLSPTHLSVSGFSPIRTVLESYFVPEQM